MFNEQLIEVVRSFFGYPMTYALKDFELVGARHELFGSLSSSSVETAVLCTPDIERGGRDHCRGGRRSISLGGYGRTIPVKCSPKCIWGTEYTEVNIQICF
tara:strand:+ start:361 stop:663 length:303 start_codon:yes stop_codon:yes gene_type:complete